jgi:non-specific serine/threonine protein kinase
MAIPAQRHELGKLPSDLTNFIGRRHELAEIKSVLAGTRLLTLTGPGGVGKTRLALRVAAELRRNVRHGAWFVELGDLRDSTLLAKVIMAALGLRDQSDRWPLSLLADYLADRELLLVLDNCEHLLDACSAAVDALLRAAPGLRVLATSRQALRVAGERVFPVPGLALPGDDPDVLPERLGQYEAIALFCDRAAAASGRFQLTRDNQDSVLQLCRQLDGVPLALELAAVRMRTLGVDEILARLTDRFGLLTGGSRAALPRQQTLRAAIDWSHDLLSKSEQAFLRRLALFAGGFDAEAAEAVASGGAAASDESLELLSSLVDKSLVTREGTATRARFRLHETMREYALARLQEAGEFDDVRRAHLHWYSAVVGAFNDEWFGPRQPEWFDRLDHEASNIRVALQYCIESPSEVDTGLDMAAALHPWWQSRDLSEAKKALQFLLRRGPARERSRARALITLGSIGLALSDLTLAKSALAEALPLARLAKDTRSIIQALDRRALGEVRGVEDAVASGLLLEEARSLASAVGDPMAMAEVEEILGFHAMQLGDRKAARDHMEVSAEVSRQQGDTWLLSATLSFVGMDAIARGDYVQAESAFKQSLRLKRRLGDRGVATIRSFQGLASHAVATDRAKRSARLQGAVATQLRRQGILENPAYLSQLVADAAHQAKQTLGEMAYVAEFKAGEAMEYEEALAYALEERPEHGVAIPGHAEARIRLGKREEEVGRLVAEGLSNKEMASRLFLSERTVETHVHNLLNKLGVNSRTQIAAWFASEASGNYVSTR